MKDPRLFIKINQKDIDGRRKIAPGAIEDLLANGSYEEDGNFYIHKNALQEVLARNATKGPTAVKNYEWPIFLKPFKLLAQPGDKGLGDIVARTVGPIGGDAYKAWYKTIFNRTCGCTERQDQLNQRYSL